MMVAPTSFSVVAKKLRHVLAMGIVDLEENSISISHPKDAKPLASHNSLNLFFYRIEDEEFPVDGKSNNPVLVGLNCLITAYGIDEKETEENATGGGGSGGGGTGGGQGTGAAPEEEEVDIKISSGENDLRIIGEVMRVLHEKPFINITENDHTMHLQSIRLPLSLDDINHIWSTQADTAYRLSVAYQFSLIPLPFRKPVQKSPLVTGVGANIYPDIHPPVLPATGFSVHISRPAVDKTVIDIKRDEWAPQISFINNKNELSYIMEIDDKETDLEKNILIAGKSGTELQFYWELWQWNLLENKGGWNAPVADVHSASIIIPGDDGTSPSLHSNILDPDNIDERLKVKVEIPVNLPPAENVRLQASLYAVRKQVRHRPQAEPYFVNIRSNLLAVTIVHKGAG